MHARKILKSIREECQEPESEDPSEIEGHDEEEDESSEEEDAVPVRAVRSYSALMQSLVAESVPKVKRRKLGNNLELTAAEGNLEDKLEAEDADRVEEPEEGPEIETEVSNEEDEEPESASDPFAVHFAAPDENVLSQRLKAIQQNEWATQKIMLPEVGKAVISIPQKDNLRSTVEPFTVPGPRELKLKQKLAGVMAKQRPSFDVLEMSVAPLIFGYKDILYCERSTANAEALRRLTCLHAINHVFK